MMLRDTSSSGISIMELDNLYQEVILDHYKHPQNKKLLLNYDAQVHHVNPSCGDEIDLNLTIVNNEIATISWDGVGCSISQASVSILFRSAHRQVLNGCLYYFR